MRPAAVLALALLLPAAARAAEPVRTPVEEADRLWAARADGSKGGNAETAPIDAVIAACRRGIEESPESLAPRWRLMRALYFKGEHATADPAEKKAIFDEGRKAGEEALELLRRAAARGGHPAGNSSPAELAPFVKDVPDVVPALLWAGVDWGKWALAFGKMAAVRQGAAAKIRDYARAVILLDPDYEDGGGYRVLGRLHHQTPSVPFLTGWASRSEALKNLRLAVKTGPNNFVNRLYLAEAIADYEPDKRAEAKAMLEALVAATADPAYLVEDRRTQEEAAALLRAWSKG